MSVTPEEFLNRPGVPAGVAAAWLEVSRGRVYQLGDSGKLTDYYLDGERVFCVRSILARKKKMRRKK